MKIKRPSFPKRQENQSDETGSGKIQIRFPKVKLPVREEPERQTARQNPEVLFIAIEKVPDALVVAMERAMDLGLKNVFFVVGDAALLPDYFAPDEVDRVYINFCDPWPSNRHAKRRLTHR
ncbi:MAG: hypothetical protein HFH18_11620, partial [Ruminococcus sp.]|nr:hypothetical protein [Ruminococcus sp.]